MVGLVHAGQAAGAAALAQSVAPEGAIAGMIGAIVMGVLACSCAIVWIVVRARRRRRLAAMSPAEREHHDALAAYRSGIRGAERALLNESQARATRLKAAERALQRAHEAGTQAVASYRGRTGSASVTPTQVVLPQGTFPLTPAVAVRVDTAGNLAVGSRSTLTRIAAGGLLFGPVGAIVGGVAKKRVAYDTRELYLLVQGENFAALITCSPDDGERVRRFALAVNQAALHAESARADCARAVADAERALAAEQQNTAPLEAAAAAVEAARRDTARLDVATRALEAGPQGDGGLSPLD